MGVRHYRELIAWQLADRLAAEIARAANSSPEASADQGYRRQLLGAVEGIGSNIAEGFLRYSRADFARFLAYALGSLAEAETRLEHGVRRGYFDASDIANARALARRTLTAIVRLKQSQL